LWCFKINGKSLQPFIEGTVTPSRSRDLPPAYVTNGAFCPIGPLEVRRQRSFYSDAIIDDPAECIDIDSEWNWRMAQALVDAAKYADYKNRFIKTDGSPERPIWDVVIDHIERLKRSISPLVRGHLAPAGGGE
jgi:hypothetical protein